MKKRKLSKRFISVILSMLMVITTLPAFSLSASAADSSYEVTGYVTIDPIIYVHGTFSGDVHDWSEDSYFDYMMNGNRVADGTYYGEEKTAVSVKTGKTISSVDVTDASDDEVSVSNGLLTGTMGGDYASLTTSTSHTDAKSSATLKFTFTDGTYEYHKVAVRANPVNVQVMNAGMNYTRSTYHVINNFITAQGSIQGDTSATSSSNSAKDNPKKLSGRRNWIYMDTKGNSTYDMYDNSYTVHQDGVTADYCTFDKNGLYYFTFGIGSWANIVNTVTSDTAVYYLDKSSSVNRGVTYNSTDSSYSITMHVGTLYYNKNQNPTLTTSFSGSSNMKITSGNLSSTKENAKSPVGYDVTLGGTATEGQTYTGTFQLYSYHKPYYIFEGYTNVPIKLIIVNKSAARTAYSTATSLYNDSRCYTSDSWSKYITALENLEFYLDDNQADTTKESELIQALKDAYPVLSEDQSVHDLSQIAYVAPTCSKEGSKTLKCNRCEKKFTISIDKVDHEYEWKSNNDGTHNYQCKNCGALSIGKQACTFPTTPNQSDVTYNNKEHQDVYTCSVCGYSYSEDHLYTIKFIRNGEELTDYTKSYKYNTPASEINKPELIATAKDNGDGTHSLYFWGAAGNEIGSVTAIATYSEQVSTEKVSHNPDSDGWKTTKEPTETETGLEETTCKDCGATITNILPVKTVQYTITYLDVSGEVIKTETVNKNTVPNKAPDLPTDSVDSDYHYSYKWNKEFVEATEDTTYQQVCTQKKHEYSNEWTLVSEATCTENATYKHVCTIDNCTFATTPTDKDDNGDVITKAIGHNWGTWTHNSDDTQTRICQNDNTHIQKATCNYSETKNIPSTCITQGLIENTCTSATLEDGTEVDGCGATKTQTLPLADHTPVTVSAVEPTCTETGLTEGEKCSVCGKIFTAQETVSALGHSVKTEFVSADCENNAKSKTYCTRCNTIMKDGDVLYIDVTEWSDYSTYFPNGLPNHPTGTEADETTTYTLSSDVYKIEIDMTDYANTGFWGGQSNLKITGTDVSGNENQTLYEHDGGSNGATSTTTVYGNSFTITTSGFTNEKDYFKVTAIRVYLTSYLKTGHNAAAAVIDQTSLKNVDADGHSTSCTENGSYDLITYCTNDNCPLKAGDTNPSSQVNKYDKELKSETVTVTARGHKYVEAVTAPTCTAQGYTTYTCSYCGDTYVDNYVPALGHNYKLTTDENNYTWTCKNDGCDSSWSLSTSVVESHNKAITLVTDLANDVKYTTASRGDYAEYVEDFELEFNDSTEMTTDGAVEEATTNLLSSITDATSDAETETPKLEIVEFDVTAYYIVDDDDEAVEIGGATATVPYGETMNIELPEELQSDDYSVRSWVYSILGNDVSEVNTAKSIDFIPISTTDDSGENPEVKVICKLTKKPSNVVSHKISLLNKGSSVAYTTYAEENSSVTIELAEDGKTVTIGSTTVEIRRPSYYNIKSLTVGSKTIAPGESTVVTITGDLQLVPNYMPSSEIVITADTKEEDIRINGEAGSYTAECWNRKIVLSRANSDANVTWLIDGKVVGYGKTYTFYATSACEVSYETDESKTPTVSISYFQYDSIKEHTVTVVSSYYAPEGVTVNGYGIVLKTDRSTPLSTTYSGGEYSGTTTLTNSSWWETATVGKYAAQKATSDSHQYVFSISRTATTSFIMGAVAYVEYTDADGVSGTVYSDQKLIAYKQ